MSTSKIGKDGERNDDVLSISWSILKVDAARSMRAPVCTFVDTVFSGLLHVEEHSVSKYAQKGNIPKCTDYVRNNGGTHKKAGKAVHYLKNRTGDRTEA